MVQEVSWRTFLKRPENFMGQKRHSKSFRKQFRVFLKTPEVFGPGKKTCSFPEKFYGCLHAPEKSENKSREILANTKWLLLVHF